MPPPRWLETVPLYPVILGTSFVITRFLESSETVASLPRPLLVVAILAVVVQGIAIAVARDRAIGSYAAAAIAMLLLDPVVVLLLLVAGAIPIVAALAAHERRLRSRDWKRLTATVNVVSSVVLLINVGLLGARVVLSEPRATPSDSPWQENAPDIYLIMLDGYPRADSMQTLFEYDNTPFLQSMEELGFDVADRSHSNYNATLLTLTTMLNMRQLGDVIVGTPRAPEDARILSQAINAASGLDRLRELGYRTLTIPSGLSTFNVTGADEVLDTGQINLFEVTIARAGMLPAVFPELQNALVHDQLRERLTSSLDKIVEVAATPATRPRFLLAHIMSPHPPIVFSANGSPVAGWGCFPRSCDPWGDANDAEARRRSLDQIVYLNVLIEEMAAGILERSTRDPVIIVFSDHGRRIDPGNPDEMLHNLFMSYTPDKPGLFPEDASPINILPRVLNAYTGTRIPMASEDSYLVDFFGTPRGGYFELTPWTP